VKIPVRDDRKRIRIRKIFYLDEDQPLEIEGIKHPVREGSLTRSILVSDQPGLIKMASGLNFLLAYPYGCTEQRTSISRAWIATKKFRELLHFEENNGRLDRVVEDCMQWVYQSVSEEGLCAYWPGTKGKVHLTAWVVQFLVEAREAGYVIDETVLDKLLNGLEKSLRSDYTHFVDGYAFSERCWSLVALTEAGRFSPSYAAELARKAEYLNAGFLAILIRSFADSRQADGQVVRNLLDKMMRKFAFQLYRGEEIYGGLQNRLSTRDTIIHATETQHIAETLRTVSLSVLAPEKQQLFINALVTLGKGDGWGTTNANASAILALSEILIPPFPGTRRNEIRLSGSESTKTLTIGPENPVAVWNSPSKKAVQVERTGGEGPLSLLLNQTYVPAGPGSEVEAVSRGFVVTQRLMKVVSGETPPERIKLDKAGTELDYKVGDVIEVHLQVVNPADRYYVAVTGPLAAGMEFLNPELATASPEAKPNGLLTKSPAYTDFRDDAMAFYYNTLPAGTYDFYYRIRATVEGRFIQPAPFAEMMYDESVYGNGNGAVIRIER